MNAMKIIRTKIYEKRARKLLSDSELATAEAEILEDPAAWPVMANTSGVRKARASRAASGKSGGVRILYFCIIAEAIFLLDMYAKNEKENITEASKKVLRETVKILKEKHYGKVH